jgi:hypothetical protein
MNFFLIKQNFLFCILLSFFVSISCRRSGVNQSYKGQSKLERKYIECQSTTLCSYRSNDEECIYKCINAKCYHELLIQKNKFLEYGEINKEFKKEFEESVNRDTINKKKKNF